MIKKVPMRQCLGCRQMKSKKELTRVVRSPEGEISLDLKGRSPGRGAYVCPDAGCFAKARKSKAFERALGVSIPEEVYEQMQQQLEGNDG